MNTKLPRLLLLTNSTNGEVEDQWLSQALSKAFAIRICHPLEAESYENSADVILVRNIWPTQNWRAHMRRNYLRWSLTGVPVYNPPTGKGDIRGKEYLCKLWQAGYPVIPSITDQRDLSRLPVTTTYFSKPLFGGSSKGCLKIPETELTSAAFRERVVQPFLVLEAEMSFVFVDNEHAFTIRNRPESRWDVCCYQASRQEINVARSFVEWNTLPRGIQRIDLCRTKEGELLLMEIEDLCPYLSLLEIDSLTRHEFLRHLIDALAVQVNERRSQNSNDGSSSTPLRAT